MPTHDELEAKRQEAIRKRKGMVLLKDADPGMILALMDGLADRLESLTMPTGPCPNLVRDSDWAEIKHATPEQRQAIRDGLRMIGQETRDVYLPIPKVVEEQMLGRTRGGRVKRQMPAGYVNLWTVPGWVRPVLAVKTAVLYQLLDLLTSEPAKYYDDLPVPIDAAWDRSRIDALFLMLKVTPWGKYYEASYQARFDSSSRPVHASAEEFKTALESVAPRLYCRVLDTADLKDYRPRLAEVLALGTKSDPVRCRRQTVNPKFLLQMSAFLFERLGWDLADQSEQRLAFERIRVQEGNYYYHYEE